MNYSIEDAVQFKFWMHSYEFLILYLLLFVFYIPLRKKKYSTSFLLLFLLPIYMYTRYYYYYSYAALLWCVISMKIFLKHSNFYFHLLFSFLSSSVSSLPSHSCWHTKKKKTSYFIREMTSFSFIFLYFVTLFEI